MSNAALLFASNVNWKIVLDVEGLPIVAGNTLRGKVVVGVTEAMPPVKLKLRFKGAERTTVEVGAGNLKNSLSGSGANRISHQARRIFCQSTVVLREMFGSDMIAQGTYVFPFEIELLSSLPSSSTVSSDGGECEICYRLSLDVVCRNKKVASKVAKRYFHVASFPLPDELVPTLVAPTSHRVSSFLANRGTLGLAAGVDDVHVGRGIDMKIRLACRNDATASVYRVQVVLIEKVEWFADDESAAKESIVAEIRDVMELPGVQRKKRDSATVKEEIRCGGVCPNELEGLHRELQSEENTVLLKIPDSCYDTYHGPLIRATHTLKITFFTKSNVSNPSIEISLRIGFPPAPRPPRLFGSSIPSAPAVLPAEAVLYFDDDNIPVAEAVIIPTDGAVEAPVASAPSEAMVLGAFAAARWDDNDEASAPLPPSYTPSLDHLLEEMISSIDDLYIIALKLTDIRWKSLLSNITPDEYGSVLAHVNMDSYQPRVAALLADVIGDRFTCDYTVAAIANVSDCNCAVTVQRLLPYCVDICTNGGIVRDALSEWDSLVVSGDYERAVSEGSIP